MASSVVLPAAKLIGNALVDEVKYLYAVKKKVESLHDELVWMGCFLGDVDANQQDEMIYLWISRITDLAGDAEDIVENYLHKVSRQRRDGIWSTMKWLSSVCCAAAALHQVGSDIDRLKHCIAELSSRMHTYGVKTQSLGRTATTAMRFFDTGVFMASLYGIDDREVLKVDRDVDGAVKILADDLGPRIVCISKEERGSGKTTFAQVVYNNEGVDAYFERKAWVYVSQPFRRRSVMEEILEKLESFTNEEFGFVVYDRTMTGKLEEEEEMVVRLFRVFREKRCLVVVDGIFLERDWAALAPPLTKVIGSYSKVLITTRNMELLPKPDRQRIGDDDVNYQDIEWNWDTVEFQSGGQPDGRTLLPPDCDSAERYAMEDLGLKMLSRCRYYPSSVALLRAMLSTKKTLADFEEVHNNMRIYEAYLHGESVILELSYYDLPYYLKPCFLHLGNFPENMEIPVEKVCRLWEIEGIVAQPTGSAARQAPVEAIVEAYLAELESRKLIQVGSTRGYGGDKSCRLHGLVRDMCRKKSKQENFLDVIEHRDLLVQTRPGSASLKNQKLRRLAIYVHKDGNNLQQLISDRNTEHVRTLMLFPTEEGIPFYWDQGTMSESMKLVRVLDFEGVCINSVPNEIGELVHLRYLNLKGTSVSSLPPSIGKLKFIQFLDLRVQECIEMMIPNLIWKLERLKHLYLPNKWKVTSCRSVIRSLMSIAEENIKLRLGGLTQLETLENLRLDECTVKDVHKMENLLHVSFGDYVVTETQGLRSFLSGMEAASQSSKRISLIRVDGGVLDEDPSILTSHSRRLIFIKIEVSGKLTIKLDAATAFPNSIQVLILEGCELEDDPMPILGGLLFLNQLKLGANSYVGAKMVCTANNFQNLRILRLVELKSLKEWNVEKYAMKELIKLVIHSCDQLTQLPAEFPSLVELDCRPCISGAERYGCRSAAKEWDG